MRFLNLAIISTALCWVFSPDGLVLLGNLAGSGGTSFFLSLTAAFVIYLFISRISLQQEQLKGPHKTDLFMPNLGRYTVLSLTLCCYLSLAILLPTGALVTAGFTFNETFLYWFPNFGFSFLLLGIVLVGHLINLNTPKYLQLVTTGITLTGLFILSLIGIIKGLSLPVATVDAPSAELSWLYIFSASLLLFLGTTEIKPQLKDRLWTISNLRIPSLLLLKVFVLSGLWAAASLLHVPGQKLAGATIPYIFSAREILGQPGRIIIGIVIISGALALLNGLLLLLQSALTNEAQKLRLRQPHPVIFQRLTAMLVCVSSGALMARGLAGYDVLETLISSALLLWLLLTGLRALFHARELIQAAAATKGLLLAPALLLIAAGYLLATTAATAFTIKTLLISLGVSTAFSSAWIRLSR